MSSGASRPDKQQMLDVLVALIPEVEQRSDLGFTRVDRQDAIMDAIVKVLEWEQDSEHKPISMDERLARRYASRIVTNRLIDSFRRERRALLERAVNSTDLSEISEALPQEPSTAYQELLRISEQLLGSLKEEERDLLQAYFADPALLAEETKRQNITPNTARVRIHRLLNRLRERGRALLIDNGRRDG